jgi:hypothetical protein
MFERKEKHRGYNTQGKFVNFSLLLNSVELIQTIQTYLASNWKLPRLVNFKIINR